MNSIEKLQNFIRKKEINSLLEHLKNRPWPDGVIEARKHYDSLGTPIANDILVEKILINDIPAQILIPPICDNHRILIYLHGGGFVFGSLQSHAGMVGEIARASHCKVLQLDYRLAPEFPFPNAINDSCMAYQWIISQGYLPQNVALVGDSAGGALVITTLLSLRDSAHIELPAAGVCISPWTDMKFSGASYTTRKDRDPLVQEKTCNLVAKLYLNGYNSLDPLASPLYADLTGLPPLLIQVGEREILYNDATIFNHRAKEFDIEIEFEEWPDMVHVWHLHYLWLSDARRALQRLGEYVIGKTHGK